MPKSKLAVLAALLLVGGVVMPMGHAQTNAPPSAEEKPSALAAEAIDKLIRALSIVIENLPQYAMPETNERGDIIIRRLNPRADGAPSRPLPQTPDECRT